MLGFTVGSPERETDFVYQGSAAEVPDDSESVARNCRREGGLNGEGIVEHPSCGLPPASVTHNVSLSSTIVNGRCRS